MIACGIEMKGSEARLALLNGNKSSYVFIDVKPHKLVLSDDENPEEVSAFRDSLYAFFRENGVQVVAIKKRPKSGEYAGGSVGFKLEGIAQLYADCRVVLCAPQTILAAKRNHPTTAPDNVLRYQQAAFETAYAILQ